MWFCITGSDSRLRLWDVESGCDTLVNFETVRLQVNKPLQLATTQDSTLVFVPCMRSVKVCISFNILLLILTFKCKNAIRNTYISFWFFRHLTCGLGTHTRYYVVTMNVWTLAGLINMIRYVQEVVVHFLSLLFLICGSSTSGVSCEIC